MPHKLGYLRTERTRALPPCWVEAEGAHLPTLSRRQKQGDGDGCLECLGKSTRSDLESEQESHRPPVYPRECPASLPVPTPCPAVPLLFQPRAALLRAQSCPEWPKRGKGSKPSSRSCCSEKGSALDACMCSQVCSSLTTLRAHPLVTYR